MPTSFSLASMQQSIQTLLSPSMEATRAKELVADFNKQISNWNRIAAGKNSVNKSRIGAELFGTASSLISSAKHILPRKHRANLRVMMRQTLKGRERALQKTVGDNIGDAGKLLDVFGGTLIMPDNADFSQVITEVKASGMKIARIKNGYKTHDPYGYADIKLNVQMPNGFIGEIILIEEHMMRMKEGPGHKIYEVGRNLQNELNQNENNPDYGEQRRKLISSYVESLQQLSHAYYSNQGREPIRKAEQEARKAYSKLHGWAFSNASSNEESGIVPLAGLGEEMYSASTNLADPSLATLTWYTFPDLSSAQEASPSPLVQNFTNSTSDALNNISTDNVASSLNKVKSSLIQASKQNTTKTHFSIPSEDEKQWKQNLADYFNGKLTDKQIPIKVSSTPTILRALGFANRNIVISHQSIEKIYIDGEGYSDSAKHTLDYKDLENLATAINDPILIVNSATQAGSIVLLTDIRTNNTNVIGIIQIDKNTRKGVYHVLISAYENTNPHMISDQIKRGELLYIDKKRALSWARSARLQLPRVASQKGKAKILTPEDIVKWENEQNNLKTHFSLTQATTISKLILAPRANEAKASSLMCSIDKAMNRWNIAASTDITHDSAARTFGELNSILAEIQRVLPDNYKINMRPYLNFGAAYARMLETGRIRSYGKLSPEQRNTLAAELQTLMDSPDILTAIRGEIADQITIQQEANGKGYKQYTQAYRTQQEDIVRQLAEGRLNTLLTSLMTDVRTKLEQYLKDQTVAKVLDRIANLMPKKKDNGKYGKGTLPADAYRTIGQYITMLDTDQPTVDAEIAKLQNLIQDATLNQTNAPQGETITFPYQYGNTKENLTLDQLESKLADWQTFGNLTDMNLDETRSAMEAIMTYIQTNRTAWSNKNKLEAWQNEKIAYDISDSIRQHTTVNDQTVRDANENATNSRKEWTHAWFTGLQSFSQMLESLKTIEGMKELSDFGINEITKAHISLNTRENNHAAAFTQIIKENAHLKTKRDIEQWILDSKLTHNTKALTTPIKEKTVTLDRKTAQDYLDLINKDDTKGFQAKQQTIIQQAKQQKIRPEKLGLITELDIPTLINELKFHPQATTITIKSKIPDSKGTAQPLHLSKAQAMYQILLYEQDRYKPNFEKHGYTEQTMQTLYQYIGKDGLAIAYGLRDYINKCGIELADTFEKLTGVPFPKEEKYFRAKFNHYEGDAKTAVIGDSNNTFGHKYSMLITRKKHNLTLDLSADIFAVANASLAETDNYICTKHITTKFRSILAHGYAADALKVKMGTNRYRQLITWLDIIDGAGTLEAAQLMAHSKFVGRMQSAKATALLAYNLLTCIKQTSALLHPIASGKIGLGELMKEYSLMTTGQSHFTFADLMQTDTFQSRFKNDPIVREILNYSADQNYGYGKRIATPGMIALEKIDVSCNALSHTALANAIYRKLEKENTTRANKNEQTMTTQEMEQIALDEVQQSLELAAQPTRNTQKSQLQAMGGTFVRLWTFMGSESINKFGNLITFAQKGEWSKLATTWATFSIWEQTIVTLWMLLMNPPKNDKDKDKFLKEQTRSLPLAMVGSVPAVGAFFDTALTMAGWGRWNNYGSQIIPTSTAISKIKKATKKKATWQDTFNASLATLQCLTIGSGIFSDSRSKPVAETASALIGLSAASNIPKVAVKATEEPKKKKR